MTREITQKILDMVDGGVLDPQAVILACLKYMSEDDVRDMAESNEFLDMCIHCGQIVEDDSDESDECRWCADPVEEEEEDMEEASA